MELLLLTSELHSDPVLPSLSLLPHTVRTAPAEPSSLLEAGTADAVLVDARHDLSSARGLCRLLSTAGRSVPVLAVVSEGGLVAVSADWGLDEILLPGTGPAEIDARLRLVVGRRGGLADQESAGKVSLGELVIDEGTYTARLRGRPLDLTYKEFELLKYLAQHAGRVFTRAPAEPPCNPRCAPCRSTLRAQGRVWPAVGAHAHRQSGCRRRSHIPTLRAAAVLE